MKTTKCFFVARCRVTHDNEAFYNSPAIEVAGEGRVFFSREAADAAAREITDAAARERLGVDPDRGVVFPAAIAAGARGSGSSPLLDRLAEAVESLCQDSWHNGAQNVAPQLGRDTVNRLLRQAIEESGVIAALGEFAGDREYAGAIDGPASVNYTDVSRYKEELRKLLLGE